MTILLPSMKYGTGLDMHNRSVAQQAFVAATRTQVTGSRIKIPAGGLLVGMRYKLKMNLTKTAAGVATSTFDISIGTAGTVADTARVSFTKPAGTAAIDEGIVEIFADVRVVSSTVGIVVGAFELRHNLAATGHAQTPVVNLYSTSASFDNTGEELYIATNLTTGAADVITTEIVEATLVAALPNGT